MKTYYCKWIDSKKIAVECPHCFDKLKKDGTPRKGAKNIIHKYSNLSSDLDNKIVNKMSHCPHVQENINIVVNNFTKRL